MPEVTVGELDVETTPAGARRVYDSLSRAPSKHFLVIGGCTHSMFMERRREELFRAVASFLAS